MVLVNPVGGDEITWMDTIKKSKLDEFLANEKQPHFDTMSNYMNSKDDVNDLTYGATYSDEMPMQSAKRINNNIFLDRNKFEPFLMNDQYMNEDRDLQMEENKFYDQSVIPCEYGLDRLCPENEECVQVISKSRQGVCNCLPSFIRNENGNCVKPSSDRSEMAKVIAENLLLDKNINNFNGEIDDPTKPEPSSSGGNDSPEIKHLTVSVVSKHLEPPDTETILSAYTVPDEKSSGDKYSYLWTLISKPNGATNGTMMDQTKDEVKLSNLSEGLYRFKVSVTGKGSYGDAYANVTVLPEKRINKPPQVVITPKEQTVKLPNKGAILDGSTSRDDDTIITWHWELVQGPIGYQPTLPETSTLQLTDLSLPGNYTFKLTVTDSDKVQNSTIAIVTVLKGIDYPPEANAGPDVILYLPHNNVTLNGSLSTDDREIVAWEWTKDSNDQSKAVDMQDTRTPYVKLSNLEEGIYTFVLKVMDASNQTSTANVHVFVKPPTNSPPIANAGSNMVSPIFIKLKKFC